MILYRELAPARGWHAHGILDAVMGSPHACGKLGIA